MSFEAPTRSPAGGGGPRDSSSAVHDRACARRRAAVAPDSRTEHHELLLMGAACQCMQPASARRAAGADARSDRRPRGLTRAQLAYQLRETRVLLGGPHRSALARNHLPIGSAPANPDGYRRRLPPLRLLHIAAATSQVDLLRAGQVERAAVGDGGRRLDAAPPLLALLARASGNVCRDQRPVRRVVLQQQGDEHPRDERRRRARPPTASEGRRRGPPPAARSPSRRRRRRRRCCPSSSPSDGTPPRASGRCFGTRRRPAAAAAAAAARDATRSRQPVVRP